MDSSDEIIIELSKTKIALGILGSFAFVIAGFWLVTLDADSIRTGSGFRLLLNSPAVAYGLGFAAIVVFGVLALFFFKKILNKEPGLIFNSSGIIDNASAASAGFIPWSEVLGSQVFEMQGQKMLVIMVANPQKYVDTGSALKRKLNQANYNMVGSPISISATTLKTKFPELCSLFDEYVRKYSSAGEGSRI
ncbi:MAG TPA: STM3941 family protein [Pyrinomonadaceae bacterium]